MDRSQTRFALALALALTLALSGCGDDGGTTDGGTDAGGDSSLDANLDSGTGDADVDGGADGGTDAGADTGMPMPVCDEATLGHLAVVTTAADYTRAAFTAMAIADHEAPEPTDLMDTDALVAQSGCQGYVLERGNGILDIIDPAAPPAITHTVDLNPAGTSVDYAINPQTVVAVGPSRAYVIEAARNMVTIIDPAIDGAAAILGEIDLSPYVKTDDVDGLVDAIDAIVIGDRAYVALGNYWFDDGFAIHFEGSELAVIDTTTDTLVDVDTGTEGIEGITLMGDNPWRGLYHFDGTDTLWVASTGDNFAVDGHIEEVDLMALSSVGIVVTESDLAGEINGFGVISPTRLVVLVGMDVVAFDPSVDFLSPTPFATEMDGMFVHDGAVWAWARGGAEPGLASFDGATGTETTPAGGRASFGDLPISSVVPVP